MIDFRYHVVSIVAVFLALALGLFLGSTTLQGTVTNTLNNQANRVRGENQRLETQKDQLSSALNDEQRFDAAVENQTVSGRLAGATVTLISAPGVSGSLRNALTATVQHAGASVGADVQLSSAFLDPAQGAQLGQLAAELAPSGHPPSPGTGVQQADALLAQMLGTRPNRPGPTQTRVQATLQAFSVGKLLSASGSPVRPGTLAVLLVNPPDDGASRGTVTAQAADLLTLVHDLDGTAMGAVVAGPTMQPGQPPGVLEAARSSSNHALTAGVSTVDGVDQAAGRIATVLALAQQRDGGSGSYGLSQNPPLPTPSP